MSPLMKRLERNLGAMFLIVVGLGGVFISAVDLLGHLDRIPFIKETDSIILLLAALLATAVGLGQITTRRKLEEIQKTVKEGGDRIIDAVGGVEYRAFDNDEELLEYVSTRLRQATRSVEDLTLGSGNTRRTKAAERAFDKYRAAAIQAGSVPTLSYREVMSFPSESHYKWAEKMLAKGMHNFRLRYFLYDPVGTPPIMNYMIIDREEVVLYSWQGGSPVRVSFRQPNLVSCQLSHFENLWGNANSLDEAGQSPVEVLRSRREQLFQESGPPRVSSA